MHMRGPQSTLDMVLSTLCPAGADKDHATVSENDRFPDGRNEPRTREIRRGVAEPVLNVGGPEDYGNGEYRRGQTEPGPASLDPSVWDGKFPRPNLAWLSSRCTSSRDPAS